MTVQREPELQMTRVRRRRFDPSFNPYNPPEHARVTFDLELTEPSHVLVNVWHRTQNVRYRSFVVENVPAGPASLFWDGRNDEGELMAPSEYRLELQAMDLSGNLSELASTWVVVFY